MRRTPSFFPGFVIHIQEVSMKVKRINPTVEELSKREYNAMIYIEHSITQRRRTPSIREIAEAIGLSTSATYDLVNRLLEWEYLKRRSNKPRRRKRDLMVKRSVVSDMG
jgi:DNA-binding MarR family transcriptional regulator